MPGLFFNKNTSYNFILPENNSNFVVFPFYNYLLHFTFEIWNVIPTLKWS
jgi:hypothetical protein